MSEDEQVTEDIDTETTENKLILEGRNEMERCTELGDYIEEYRTKRLSKKKDSINGKYDVLLTLLIDVLDVLIQEQCMKQKEGKQGKVKYIIFHSLLTSVYTGSLEIAVGMGNSMLYLDKYMSYTYWKPELIYKDIDKDMEDVRRLLGQKYIRIEDYELLFLKRKLFLDDWTVFCEILKKIKENIAEKIQGSSLLMEDNVQILCGGYMEKLQKIN